MAAYLKSLRRNLGQYRFSMLACSIGLYVVALFLPSYTFVTPDHRFDIHQWGFQSLVDPPAPSYVITNMIYFMLLALILTLKGDDRTKLGCSIPLLVWTLFSSMMMWMGDRMPGSVTEIGPAGPLWFLAIILGVIAASPYRRVR